jgi:hypothetical protein
MKFRIPVSTRAGIPLRLFIVEGRQLSRSLPIFLLFAIPTRARGQSLTSNPKNDAPMRDPKEFIRATYLLGNPE